METKYLGPFALNPEGSEPVEIDVEFPSGRSIKVNRGHLAGLELALSELDIDGAAAVKLLGMIDQTIAASVGDDYPGITAEHLEAISRNSQADSKNLLRLDALLSAKAQASASPEQEPVAWMVGQTVWENRSAAVRHAAERMTLVRPLYTHADDGELERLRAEKQLLEAQAQNDSEANTAIRAERDQFRQKLAEAQALLRDADNWVRVLRTQFGYDQTKDLANRVEAFLSATPSLPR